MLTFRPKTFCCETAIRARSRAGNKFWPMGDNLDDHSVVFENRSVADRFAEVEKAKDLFGKKYILLPNAMYGTWENILYNKGMTDAQKVARREELLELP